MQTNGIKRIPKSEFRQLSGEQILENLPFILLMEGEPMCIVARPEDVIYLGDLHPRVKIQLKNMENKVRMGMPPIETVYHEEVPLAVSK